MPCPPIDKAGSSGETNLFSFFGHLEILRTASAQNLRKQEVIVGLQVYSAEGGIAYGPDTDLPCGGGMLDLSPTVQRR